MKYFSHKELQNFFDVSHITVYRWFPVARGGMTPERVVLDALNDHRRGGQRRLSAMPERLYRTDALADWLSANGPRRKCALSTRRLAEGNAPHFKLGRLILFHLPSILEWLEEPRRPARKSSLDSSDDTTISPHGRTQDMPSRKTRTTAQGVPLG